MVASLPARSSAVSSTTIGVLPEHTRGTWRERIGEVAGIGGTVLKSPGTSRRTARPRLVPNRGRAACGYCGNGGTRALAAPGGRSPVGEGPVVAAQQAAEGLGGARRGRPRR